MKKLYKIYRLRVHEKKDGLYKSTLELPENIEFLSVEGYINHYLYPIFSIRALEDSSHSNILKKYEFLLITKEVNIELNGYEYIGSTLAPHKYTDDFDQLDHFDVFVKKL